MILAGNYIAEFDRNKQVLDNTFKIKNLGALKYFRGLEASQSSSGISICQRKYCLDLLHEAGCLGSKPISTPLDSNAKLNQDIGEAYKDVSSY